MSVHLDSLLLSKRVLLLQGPMGSFFNHFASWLKNNNIESFKINFNGGDEFYSRSMHNVLNYRGVYSDFSSWIEHLLLTQEIDAIVCFGDCRQYHRMAKKAAYKNKIKFFAFEEGYIRPNYITFEQGGVNFFSNFLSHIKLKNLNQDTHNKQVLYTDSSYKLMVKSAIIYYFFMSIFFWKYPNYTHHRQMSVWTEIYYGLWSIFRRLKNYFTEERCFNSFLQQYSKKYFIFALQVHNDFQIRTHSDLKCMQEYIQVVIESFAQHADASQHLVLKHHPVDRGYRNYAQLIHKLSKLYGVEGRIHYFCDIHLPTLLKNSLGFITVNSTTGIQALYHNVPVKVLGYALYNLPKLTNQHPLINFWENPGQVDHLYFEYFRKELISYSQLNGAFYGKSPWMINYRTKHIVVLIR